MAGGTGTNVSQIFDTAGKHVNTMEELFRLLGEVVSNQEEDLNKEISRLAETGGNIDQGALLKVQGMVQTWGVTSGLATGTLRAAGDALTKTTQNIR
jgi:hypothetical protein